MQTRRCLRTRSPSKGARVLRNHHLVEMSAARRRPVGGTTEEDRSEGGREVAQGWLCHFLCNYFLLKVATMIGAGPGKLLKSCHARLRAASPPFRLLTEGL